MRASVTIGFTPRERYEVAAESLGTILDNTPEPYELIVVAPAVPPRYRAEMDAVLVRRPETVVIETDDHLLPAASKNLVVERATGDFVALVENDVLYPSGWLDGLLAAAHDHPADVVTPAIREGRGDKEHYDHHLGTIVDPGDDGPLEIRSTARSRNDGPGRERVDFAEQHCLLYRRRALDAIAPFDDELNTRDEVDVSLDLWHHGMVMVLEPAVAINYVAPTAPPNPDELDYFRFRWDLERAARSRERIRERWNLIDTPGDLGFVRGRVNLLALPGMHDELADLIADGGRAVLVENGEWFGSDITRDLDLVPFPDLGNGAWGGFPIDDRAAIEAYDTARRTGATQLAVAWPASWWLRCLPAFEDHLLATSSLVRDDERLAVYALDPV